MPGHCYFRPAPRHQDILTGCPVTILLSAPGDWPDTSAKCSPSRGVPCPSQPFPTNEFSVISDQLQFFNLFGKISMICYAQIARYEELLWCLVEHSSALFYPGTLATGAGDTGTVGTMSWQLGDNAEETNKYPTRSHRHCSADTI